MAMNYSDKVMDHFSNPRNVGEIENASGVGTVGNAKCGDIMRMYLDIEDDVITDVKFKTFGCGAAIATSMAQVTGAVIPLIIFSLKSFKGRIHIVKHKVDFKSIVGSAFFNAFITLAALII